MTESVSSTTVRCKVALPVTDLYRAMVPRAPAPPSRATQYVSAAIVQLTLVALTVGMEEYRDTVWELGEVPTANRPDARGSPEARVSRSAAAAGHLVMASA